MVIAALGSNSSGHGSQSRHGVRSGANAMFVPTLLEGVAGRDGSILEAALKPLRALGGTSMGERLGVHVSGGHALQTVVTHSGRSPEALVNISGIQQVA